MPRPLLIRSEIHPYHVTARCNNKEFFPLPLDEVWTIMLEELKAAAGKNSLCIHAFVLMGNHFHLLCHTPEKNLDVIMQSFMRNTSIRIKTKSGQINHLWGGPYRWSLIRSQKHYFQVYRYIYQNPLRAGIVSKVEKYPYSTLKDGPLLIYSYIPMSFGGREGELVWLNEKYKDDESESIRKGLRKGEFGISSRKRREQGKR
ncbi:MAG: transposase [Bacteriovoracaceae bacterium]